MHHDTSIGQVYRLCADGDGSGPLHEGSHDGVTGWREMETKIFHCHHCRISESLTSTWEGDVGWKVYASPIQLLTAAVTGLTESV